MKRFFSLLATGLIAVCGQLIVTPAFAGGKGVGSTGGGDLHSIFPELKLKPVADPARKAEIIALFQDDLMRTDLTNWLSGVRMFVQEKAEKGLTRAQREKEDPYPAMWDKDAYLGDKPWLTGRLLHDIENSDYALIDRAIVINGSEKDAFTYHSSTMRVFFSLDRLSRYDIPLVELKQKLQALLYHEHLRHIGIPDEDYAYGKLAMDRTHDITVNYSRPDGAKRITISHLGFDAMLAIARALAAELGEKDLLCRFPDGPEAGKESACPGIYGYDINAAVSPLPDDAKHRIFERLNAEMRAMGFHRRINILKRFAENGWDYLGSWVVDDNPVLEARAWKSFLYRVNFEPGGERDMQLSPQANELGRYMWYHFCHGDGPHARTSIPACSELDPLQPGALEETKNPDFLSD